MKIFSIKTLLLVVSLLIFASINATTYGQRPRRGVEKRYTSPEEIQRRQDSIRHSLNGEAEVMLDTMVCREVVYVEPRNTPEQIDSIMALWRASISKERYDNYFAAFRTYSDTISSRESFDSVDSLYISRLQAIMTPVPLTYNREVRTAIERFCSPAYADIFSYAYYYFPIIEEEFINAGIPVEIRALAIVESSLNPLARSNRDAVGLWQFMPSTGKEYGLEINSMVDERCNPRLASRAAAQYLKRMYNVYGDWTLAIAAYNCGPGRVNRALSLSGVSL